MSKWSYEIWHDGCCVRADSGYETEEEAYEEAKYDLEFYLEEFDDVEREDCEIRVEDYFDWAASSNAEWD